MRLKTSVALSQSTLHYLDQMALEYKNRSAVVEAALVYFFEQKKKSLREAKDLMLLNKKSNELNQEAEDVLSYQVKL